MHEIRMANSTMDRHCAILDCRLLIYRIAREVYAD
jgi:hypothetical protein